MVLVNETMARTMWPGRSAIGGCVQAGHAGDPMLGDPMSAAASLPCRTVVGVVRDSRARSLRTEGNEAKLMQYYVPLGQAPPAPFPNIPEYHGILVRTAGEPERWVTPIQRIIQSTSSRPVYARVSPYQTLIDPQLRSWRLGATLFSAFGLLALAIAAVGLFAVVSYLVTQRTREIGVRLALGGSAGGVAGLVVRDAVRMAPLVAWQGLSSRSSPRRSCNPCCSRRRRGSRDSHRRGARAARRRRECGGGSCVAGRACQSDDRSQGRRINAAAVCRRLFFEAIRTTATTNAECADASVAEYAEKGE